MADARPVTISRHAVERYIERVEPLTVPEARLAIRGMLDRSKFFGRAGRVLKGGMSLVVYDRTVVTVLTKDQKSKRRTIRRTFELEDEGV